MICVKEGNRTLQNPSNILSITLYCTSTRTIIMVCELGLPIGHLCSQQLTTSSMAGRCHLVPPGGEGELTSVSCLQFDLDYMYSLGIAMKRAVEQKSRQKLKAPQCFNCGEAVGLVTKSHFPLHFGPVEPHRSGNRRTHSSCFSDHPCDGNGAQFGRPLRKPPTQVRGLHSLCAAPH